MRTGVGWHRSAETCGHHRFTIGADLLLAAIDGARPEVDSRGGIPAAAVEVRRIQP